MSNVIGIVGWIAIIAAIVRYRRRRKAAMTAQQQTQVPRTSGGRRVHPDLGAGLALGYAITEMHHGDPAAAHLGHIATAAYWSSELGDSEPDDDDVDEPD